MAPQGTILHDENSPQRLNAQILDETDFETKENSAQVGKDVLVSRMSESSALFRESFTARLKGKELAELYDKWAADYEKDTDGADYQAPQNTVAVFRKLFPSTMDPTTAKVLDCGCGTGKAAVFLSLNTDGRPRFENLHGLDFSPGMLRQAKANGMPYVSLMQGDVLQPLNIADNEFDAMVSVGMFTSGNVGPEAWPQLLRIVKPGGIVCASVQEHVYHPDGHPEKLRQLERDGKCRVIDEERVVTMARLDTHGIIVTVEVL